MAPTTATPPATGTPPRPRQSTHRRGHGHPPQPSGPAPRAFGGRLTRLHADAPPFVPATVQPAQSHNTDVPSTEPTAKPPKKPPPARAKRRFSRSSAPDISTRTHEDIGGGVYECAICTNEVSRHSKIWSCRTCWTVFHIGCIKKWSKNEGAAVQQQAPRDDNLPAPKQWRCPGCNLPKDTLPSSYTCWCEKEMDPKAVSGLPPHSCGQTCGRERTFPQICPHPCDLVCHAGPCPPCTHMGPQQSCFCGKNTTTRKCTDTDYDRGWSCQEVCGDVMPCGLHTCPRPCHEGLCGACETEVPARCYCGKVEKPLQCCENGEEKQSYDWTGTWDCEQVCGNLMDCGQHRCEKSCHPQDAETPHCPRSPDRVTHCPCGKTSLTELTSSSRTSCTDPIPSCDKSCGKMLACGHACQQICHLGECLPCLLTVDITCRCGRNTFPTVCHQGSEEPPQCVRVCKATLNCGRHECGEHCCTGERKSIERQATKRKLKSLGSTTRMMDDGIEAEHICTRTCGRTLKCGNHTCPDLCHKGPCGSCKEAVFEDITCDCGRTVLQAPLPCGTSPPPCTFPCRRPKTCGHPQVAHNCHPEAEGCPKCPFLTEKLCLCGKKTLKNQPCWRTDVPCGLVCGKLLKCGYHTCQKLCHRPGDCEDAHSHCQQECGKPKKTCGHPCEKYCHAPSACKEDKSCPFKVMITCDCQRKKEEVKCNARAGVPDPPGRQQSLKCDDECARLERNRILASALHVPENHEDQHVPYSTATLNMYLEDVAWAHKQEAELRVFAMDAHEKRYRCKPMKQRQRAFIHSLAEDFGFDSESLDPEPHRHVQIFKTPKFVAAPMKTLAQAARISRAALKLQAPVNSGSERKANEVKHIYNGFLLSKPKFGITEDELKPHIVRAAPSTQFNFIFMASGDSIALLPSSSWETPEQTSILLTSLHPIIEAQIAKHSLAASTDLCQFDTTTADLRIVHQHGKQDALQSDGWSKVAAKKSSNTQAPVLQAIGQRPVYTVLGSKLAEAKKKKLENEEKLRKVKKEETVVDDWEKEADGDDVASHVDGVGIESDKATEQRDQVLEQVKEGEINDTA